jgi:hypothetical protein
MALVVLLVGCGSSGASRDASVDGAGPGGFKGTFTIQGAPHNGTYGTCDVSGDTITCSELPGCGSCEITIELADLSHTAYDCADGSASIVLLDSSLSGSGIGALCESAAQDGGAPQCPESPAGCNQVIGACAVSVSAISSAAGSDVFGHFSGSLTATLPSAPSATYDSTLMAACWNDGSGGALSISASGSW